MPLKRNPHEDPSSFAPTGFFVLRRARDKHQRTDMQLDRTAELKARLEHDILVLDGAMGTLIQRRGLREADYRGTRFAAHPHLSLIHI